MSRKMNMVSVPSETAGHSWYGEKVAVEATIYGLEGDFKHIFPGRTKSWTWEMVYQDPRDKVLLVGRKVLMKVRATLNGYDLHEWKRLGHDVTKYEGMATESAMTLLWAEILSSAKESALIDGYQR